MNNEERDKYLTEQIGGYDMKEFDRYVQLGVVPDFSTPDGFFKLWDWAHEQEWWHDWLMLAEYKQHPEIQNGKIWNPVFLFDYIHPDRFADAVYTFLKERNR